MMQTIVIVLLSLRSGVAAFGVSPPLTKPPPPTFGARSRSLSKSRLFGIRCENKYYQLEEMEDQENSTTELYLKQGGTILFGETDGPLWSTAEGNWSVKPGTDDFTMTISKTFSTGSSGRDMGEFEFRVDRCYTGEMAKVGECVAIVGSMEATGDDDGNDLAVKKVGFFNMIDGTDVRRDRRADAAVNEEEELQDKNDASATHQGLAAGMNSQGQQQARQPFQGDGSAFAAEMQQEQQAYGGGMQQAASSGYGGQSSYEEQMRAFAAQQQADQKQQTDFAREQQALHEQQILEQQQAFAQQQAAYGQAQQDQTQQAQDPYQAFYEQQGGQEQTPQQQQAPEEALPPGWEKLYDESQGQYYYNNQSTGVAQWEFPGAAGNSLPEGWVEDFDASQQRPFFVNTISGATQWDRPV